MTDPLSRSQRAFLASVFPGDAFADDAPTLAAFAIDSSQKQAMPWAVVRPEGAEQVSALLQWAAEENVPVYTRARGTNKVGGTVPVRGGVVVSTLRMNRILDIDEHDFAAEIQPGVVTADFAAACAKKGLLYPPDPASVRVSTVGGNVATCAGGLRAVKYGVTRDYVLGVEAVVPGGEVLRLGSRCHKDVVGLDLARLFVGSAGTLGILTALTLKLLPLPEARASVLAAYRSQEVAIEAAHAVFAAGVLPTACEFMDAVTMTALSRLTGEAWLAEAGGVVLLQSDGLRGAVDAEISRMQEVLDSFSPLRTMAGRGAEEARVWELRRQLSEACFTLAPDKLSEDVAVPRGRLAEALAGFRAIGAELGVTVVVYGHLGDGNLHVNTMYRRADEAEAARARECRERILALALDLGGTASGEHGLGLSKRDHLARQVAAPELARMRAVKGVFDPTGIMNPGKEWS
jgi:glycolate oxidase